jgi:hypothetical protein
MLDLPVQSFQPNDLPVFNTRSDLLSSRSRQTADGTTSFSDALEKASASRSHTDEQVHDDAGQQAAIERNRAAREHEHQTAQTAPVKEQHTENHRQADRDTAVSKTDTQARAQDAAKAATQASTQSANTGADSAAQQAAAVVTPSAKGAPDKNVEVTISWSGSGDDLKVNVQGLPQELLTALLAALGNSNGTVQTVALEPSKQTVDSSLDGGSLTSDGNVKLSVKLSLDPADALKGINEIASLIQSLTEALQKKVSKMIEPDPAQMPITDSKAPGLSVQLLMKEAPANGAPTGQGLAERLTAAFKDLVSVSGTQDTQATPNGSNALNGSTGLNGSNGLNLIPNGASELKLSQGTDLTESLLSRMKVTVSLAGVVEGAAGTAEKGADLPSEGNGKSAFGEQGATMQAGIQRQEPAAVGSNTTSFGSIVADRLAAVAEQVGLRERSLDITLRLKTEGGESLMIGLKEQAGKMIIQVRSADENVVNFLQSQKETIVRHLEAKQISSSISVNAIEEDVSKRQGREQPKNNWGRRREPSDPNIEASI